MNYRVRPRPDLHQSLVNVRLLCQSGGVILATRIEADRDWEKYFATNRACHSVYVTGGPMDWRHRGSPPEHACKSSSSVNFDAPAITGSCECPCPTRASEWRTSDAVYARLRACEFSLNSSHHETLAARSSLTYANAPSARRRPRGAVQTMQKQTASPKKTRLMDIFGLTRLARVPALRHGTNPAYAALPPVARGGNQTAC